jgi:hypothetical protein
MSLSPIRYISFDCYGTLVNFRVGDVARDRLADRVPPDRMAAFLEDFTAYRFDEVLGAWQPYPEVLHRSLERTCRRWGVGGQPPRLPGVPHRADPGARPLPALAHRNLRGDMDGDRPALYRLRARRPHCRRGRLQRQGGEILRRLGLARRPAGGRAGMGAPGAPRTSPVACGDPIGRSATRNGRNRRTLLVATHSGEGRLFQPLAAAPA